MISEADILIVEDTSSLLMVYEALLARAGYKTVSADTTDVAIVQEELHAPEVILMDVMLPDGNGLELMHRFLKRRPNLRVIVITSNGSMNMAVDAMRHGAFDFLVKPIADDKLLASVAAAMAHKVAPVGTLAPDHPGLEAALTEAMLPLVGHSLEDLERAYIEATISRCDGSLPRASELLQLAPSTLYRKREAWKTGQG